MSTPGFAAGTLVCIAGGLFPIHAMCPGSQVLAAPARRPLSSTHEMVAETVVTSGQAVHALALQVRGQIVALFASPDSQLLTTNGWQQVSQLRSGYALAMPGGRSAHVQANGLVQRTQHADVGVAVDRHSGQTLWVDLSGQGDCPAAGLARAHCFSVPVGGYLTLLGAEQCPPVQGLILGEPQLMPVYGLTIWQAEAYCVSLDDSGDVGVWARAAPATQGGAFAEDTLVWVESKDGLKAIQLVEPGERVLSRCESTGEIAFKPVAAVVQRGFSKPWRVTCEGQPGESSFIELGGEQALWVEGKGWVVAPALQAGDELLSEGAFQVRVSRVSQDPRHRESFSVSVADFHTIFVGSRGLLCRAIPASPRAATSNTQSDGH